MGDVDRSRRRWRELLAALLLTASVTAWGAPLRIPIGDSITQGGKREVKEYTYRWPLTRMLRDEGVEFEFIGTRTEGIDPGAAWPAPVVAVAQDADWNADPADPSGDTFDGVHPNLKGQRKMAEQWLAAMRPLVAARSRPSGRAGQMLVRAGAVR